jgi:hypothetical protein
MLSSLISFGAATPFDNVNFSDPNGLTLTSCSCAGTNNVYIPRGHIDWVSSGRSLYIKTLLSGVGLLILGAVTLKKANDDATGSSSRWNGAYYETVPGSTPDTTWQQAVLYIGIALVIYALIAMIPQVRTQHWTQDCARSPFPALLPSHLLCR